MIGAALLLFFVAMFTVAWAQAHDSSAAERPFSLPGALTAWTSAWLCFCQGVLAGGAIRRRSKDALR